MAEILQVSESGYHLWKKRQSRPKTEKEQERSDLTGKILEIYIDSNCVYGIRKITRELSRKHSLRINHKTVEKILKEQGIVSKTRKKYKATTNSKHNLPVTENVLNREFTAVPEDGERHNIHQDRRRMALPGLCNGSVRQEDSRDGYGQQYDQRTGHRRIKGCQKQVRKCKRLHTSFGQRDTVLFRSIPESAARLWV